MRKRTLTVMVLFLGFLLFAGVVGAAPITFTDVTEFTATGTTPGEDLLRYGRGDVNKLDGWFDYVYWAHHFEFNPPAAEVLSGELTLTLRDDDDSDCGWFSREFALGIAEDGTWDWGEVDTGSYTYNVGTSFLEDGTFRVILVSLGGDFFIDKSELKITYNPSPVPEPATVLLLGVGLLAIGIFSTRKVQKKA